jgi:glycosyltransferase involved in cell wall biosynthesis
MTATRLRILCLSNMYPSPANPDYGAFIEVMCDAIERAGHDVVRVVIDTRASGPLHTPAKYGRLAAGALRHTRHVDVIYGHFLFPTGAVAALAGRLIGRPWVLTAHGQDVRNLQNPRIRALSRTGIAGAAGIIAVSRYLSDELGATGLPLPPVHVANMGVDLERFTPSDRDVARATLGIGPGALILAVGGLTERKNPLRLLQAFTKVRATRPDAMLAFVGDGPLRGALDAGIAARDLSAAVMLPGALPHDQVATWLAAADLLALPSLVEPLGIVALEAMASGRPVVATTVGGTVEVVGRAGAIVDPLDPDAIASGLLDVLADPPSVAVCRAAAALYSVDRQAARVLDVLAEAVSSRLTPR